MKFVKLTSGGRIILYNIDKVVPVIPVLLLLILWALMAWFIAYSFEIQFPGPLETFRQLYQYLLGQPLFEQSIYVHVYFSLKRFVFGLTFAAMAGIFLGLMLGYSRFAKEHLYPIVSILQPIPSIAWIPIVIMLIGIGDMATISIIFLAAIWPNIVNTVAGAESVPENYLRVAQMFRLRKLQVFAKIIVPHSIPYIINGLRISVANSWRALVAAEMIAATGTGLGYVILNSRVYLDYTTALACIVIIAVIGYTLEKIVFQHVEYVTLKKWGMVTA